MDRLDIRVSMYKFRLSIVHWDRKEMDCKGRHEEVLLLNKRLLWDKRLEQGEMRILRGGGLG